MRVIVIGATGTIGTAVVSALERRRHDVIRASRRGRVWVDLADHASIDALFESVGNVDAVVCCAASGRLTPLEHPHDDAFTVGLRDKLLGQVHLVRRALKRVNDRGSITLTSGAFDHPMPGSSFAALTNSGLEGFVWAAAAEMPRGVRLNVVSPGWVRETLQAMGEDGSRGIPAVEVARSYEAAVEGTVNGQTIRPDDVARQRVDVAQQPG
ncbi:short chain dehydrogenase [Phytoactinopolyspora halotolerans]|uniref:Short chain dehydrogenase n=1 Tax=Phytoactinopolyspora halotolerans TaxID=1981512 RepID=A0A6L9SJD9_9ACTN|nr:short chain dehydrogenase [Phytoactinopolyspora halotolerans]NEE04411.1 short chain dehydrogenase [Phytoactinopolyspora halotolerans]